MNTHEKYNTVNHIHLDMIVPSIGDVDLGLMLVECADGKWYIEQEFSTSAYDKVPGVVKSQTDITTKPVFYSNEKEAEKAALDIVKSVYPDFIIKLATRGCKNDNIR